MRISYRRYEFLLPLRFNDGQVVSDDLIAQTLLDIRKQFGAVSAVTQIIRGIWEHEGSVHRDDLSRIYVDVPDIAETHTFFSDFKETLKSRFKQIEIWMTTYPIEVI
jgi:hypothetical protein